jgi:hypothetical protein
LKNRIPRLKVLPALSSFQHPFQHLIVAARPFSDPWQILNNDPKTQSCAVKDDPDPTPIGSRTAIYNSKVDAVTEKPIENVYGFRITLYFRQV